MSVHEKVRTDWGTSHGLGNLPRETRNRVSKTRGQEITDAAMRAFPLPRQEPTLDKPGSPFPIFPQTRAKRKRRKIKISPPADPICAAKWLLPRPQPGIHK